MLPHVEEVNSHTVLLACGGNDLPARKVSDHVIQDIANYLIVGGLECRERLGVTKVIISSVLPRADSHFQGNRHKLNKVLRDLCAEHNFIFLENSNIILREHICYDGVHLNDSGSELFHRNILSILNR